MMWLAIRVAASLALIVYMTSGSLVLLVAGIVCGLGTIWGRK